MYSAIVDDPSVHPATRAHFRAAKQLGAGAVLGIDAIEDAVELPDEAFLHEVQGYLNHPRGAITLATRCTGKSERTKCDYHASKLRECPPCAVGAAKEPHILTRYEHFNGTHWDGCRYGGHVGTGHTSINTHVVSIARALGAAGSLQEVKLGPRDPNRAVDKESNPNQRGDGVLGNWTHSARRMVFDGTTITAVQFRKGMLGPLARGKHLATDYAEQAKRSAKAAACAANNYDFMTWAASTRGGIGREAAEWFTTGFAAKVALARSDGEKWRVRNERKRLLQQHSAIMRGATGRSPSATRGRGWAAWRRERRQSSGSRVGGRGSRLSSVLSERPVSVKQRLSDSRRECVVCRADQSCLMHGGQRRCRMTSGRRSRPKLRQKRRRRPRLSRRSRQERRSAVRRVGMHATPATNQLMRMSVPGATRRVRKSTSSS